MIIFPYFHSIFRRVNHIFTSQYIVLQIFVIKVTTSIY